MKKILKYLFYLLFLLSTAVGLYFLIAYLFTFFPKSTLKEKVQSETIYILYSDIHTDIVLNIKDINISKFSEFKNKKKGYMAFGWGDKEVYLNTPELSSLKVSDSLKAFFINTPSLMHMVYIPHIQRYKNIKKIELSKNQKEHLIASIMKSFKLKGKTYRGYGKDDFFYDANKPYNLVNTCNTWTGDKLRESNVSIPYWTPFVWSVVNEIP